MGSRDPFTEELLSLKDQVYFPGTFKVPAGIDKVIIAGMGGSGIVGRLFSELYGEKPVMVSSGYTLPEFTDAKTLVICISYSGNTAETVSSFNEAKRQGAAVVVISSGGILGAADAEAVIVPKGKSPRSAIGYMLMPLLNAFGAVSEKEKREAALLLDTLDRDNSEAEKMAAEIFSGSRMPLVYSTFPNESIAYRWNTQFNENSKILSFWGSFPELNHNNTMALKLTYRKNLLYPICLVSTADKRILKRIKATEDVTGMKFRRVLKAKGSSPFSRALYLIHLGDYVTYHLARMRGVDPLDVSTIEELKRALK